MIKETKITNGMRVQKKKTFIKDEVTNKTAVKKQEILDILSEGSQLTLLGTLVEQIGDSINLDTPEFTEAKALFAKIREVLQ